MANSGTRRCRHLTLALRKIVGQPGRSSRKLRPGTFSKCRILERGSFIFGVVSLRGVDADHIKLSPCAKLISPTCVQFAPGRGGRCSGFACCFLVDVCCGYICGDLNNSNIQDTLGTASVKGFGVP